MLQWPDRIEGNPGMATNGCLAKVDNISAAMALTCSVVPASACTGDQAGFCHEDYISPYLANFSSQASVAGLDVDVGVSQHLQRHRRGDGWNFETKITGFVYGLYGSITDSSDFSILPDNSYQTRHYSRKAQLYGVIPIEPTSFRQQFKWYEDGTAEVRSRY